MLCDLMVDHLVISTRENVLVAGMAIASTKRGA